MSGIYTVQFTDVAVTVQQDFFEITGSATQPFIILGWGISQNTDFGDAQEEGLNIILKSGQTSSGTGGSAPSKVALDGTAPAAGFAAEANNTTKASGGTIVTHYPYNWNVRTPIDIWYPDMHQPIMAAARRATLELAKTPADSITVSGYIIIQEIG